jgi:Flp pilus assembly protein TadD
MPATVNSIVDITAIVVGAFAFFTLLYIIVRKFSVLSTIDTSIVPKHQQEAVRDKLAEKRLMRKFTLARESTKTFLSPFLHRIADAFDVLMKRLLHLEKRTRFSLLQKAKFKEANTDRIADLLSHAEEHLAQGQYKEAESHYIEAVSIKPTNIQAFKKLGDIYMNIKDFASAKESYAHAISLKERKSQAHVPQEADDDPLTLADHYGDLSACYREMQDYPHACIALQEVLKYQPNNPKFLDDLLTICIAMKDVAKAQDALQRLREVNPENQKLQEFSDAVKELEKVVPKK